MESVSLGGGYELRYDGGLLDVWYQDRKRLYRCDPRMVRYKFTRARVLGGEYLEFWGETMDSGFTHKLKAENVESAKAFVKQVFEGGTLTAQVQSGVPTPDAPAGSDHIDQLSRLADLRDRGVLNDEEFAAEKARILADG